MAQLLTEGQYLHIERVVLSVGVLIIFIVVGWLASFTLKRIGKNQTIYKLRIFRLVAGSINTAIVGLGVITALGTLGVNITALVAGLGLTGFAIGFALKDAITNLVSGILILLYAPFDLGDVIEISGMKGEVVDVNLRYVSIKTETDTALIPNGNFISSVLKKLG